MAKPHQTTIVDIAKELGISPSTVSRALNDHPGISEKTKNKVKAYAKKHHYNPNRLAQSLLYNKHTGIIGIVVPEISSYFFSTAINGVQDMVDQAGYKLLICQTNESLEKEKKLVQDLIALRIDGLIISPSYETNTYTHLENLQKAGIPLVLFDRDCPSLDANKVVVDNYEAAFKGIDFLIKNNCKQIAHISGPKNIPTFQQRLNGYLDAHKTNNLKVDKKLIVNTNDFTSESGTVAAEKLLSINNKIDAIFCVNDAIAFGVIQFVLEQGYRIPEDIAVLGFDDEPYAALSSPSLSTIWQPAYELGMLSAKILLDNIFNKNSRKNYRHEILSPELMLRKSTKDSFF